MLNATISERVWPYQARQNQSIGVHGEAIVAARSVGAERCSDVETEVGEGESRTEESDAEQCSHDAGRELDPGGAAAEAVTRRAHNRLICVAAWKTSASENN